MNLSANQLVNRYLKSVASFLPADQKDDILRELAEDLRSQMEDKESELGRSLTEAEQEAILKLHGHPLVVASRYRQDQRSVSFGRRFIGPVLFAPYAKVLSFNLGLTSAIIIIIFTAMFVAGQRVTIFDGLSALLYQFLIQFGVITLIFSVMQTHLDKYPDRWSARNPSGFEFSSKIYQTAPQHMHHVSRLESIGVIVASAMGLVWFSAVRRNPYLVLFSASATLSLGPVWAQIYWPSVILVLASMFRALANLARPDWTRLRDVARIAVDSASLGILMVLAKAGDWIVLKDGVNASTGDRHVIAMVNQCFYYSLLAAGAIVAVLIIVNLWRLIRGELQRRPAPTQASAHNS
jgi:hypothetical protein